MSLMYLGSSFHIVGPAMPKALLRTTVELVNGIILCNSSSSAFSVLMVGASCFHSPCASPFHTPVSFRYFSITSLHLGFGFNLSVYTHFRLPCSHYYIFLCLSLFTSQPSRSRFSIFLTYVCHTEEIRTRA